jgi:hypothetical protein
LVSCLYYLNEELVDVVVCGIFEETGMTMTVDDLLLLRGKVVRVPFPDNKTQHIYEYVAFAHACLTPYVTCAFRALRAMCLT